MAEQAADGLVADLAAADDTLRISNDPNRL